MTGIFGGGSSTTPATSSNTTTNAPWSGVIPDITQGLADASSLYQQGGPQYYPGQTYAGSNDALNSGISTLNNIGSTYGGLNTAATNSTTGILNSTSANNPSNSFFSGMASGSGSIPGLSTLNDYASGKYLSADNPYFQQMSDNIKAQVLPGINSQFSQAGRGNSGLAGRAVGQGLGDSIGSLAYQNYQQGLTQQQQAAQALSGISQQGASGLASNFQNNAADRLNAASLDPTLQNTGINAGNASLLAGTTEQGLQQGYLTDAQNRYNYGQQQPYANLQNYISNITGQTGGTGTSTSSGTSTPAIPSFWNQALGAGLGAASFFLK